MADSDKDIVITPNRSQTDQPTIEFTGQDATTIRLSALDTAALSFEGSEGQLLTITDDLSGDLFSVTDMSGIPAFTINSSANIGIGETTPLGQLHIKEEDSGQTTVGTSADQLVLEGGTYTGMTMLSTGQGLINFGDAEDNNIGQITYSHSSNALLFVTNNAEKMRIHSPSNGLVSIGTGSATNVSSSYGQLTLNGSVGGLIQFTDNDVDKCRILSAADDLYTHITGDMIFRTGGFTTSDESVRIKADGKVGIGTNAPAELLHVSGGNTRLDGIVTINGNEDSGDAFNGSAKLRIAENGGAAYIQIKSTTTSNVGVLCGDTDDDFTGGFIYANNGDLLRIYAGNSERLTIDGTNSRFGFFNSSPTARFHFNLSTVTTDLSAFLIEATDAGASSAPDLTLYRNSASPADNDTLGTVWFYGNNDAATAETQRYGGIQAVIEDVTDGSEKGRLAFLTGQANNVVAERMTIRSGGNVGIGTTIPTANLEVAATDASSTLNLYGEYTTPADDDVVGKINFYGDDSIGVKTDYGNILVKSSDVTAGSEEGAFALNLRDGSDLIDVLTVGNNSSTTFRNLQTAGSTVTQGLYFRATNTAATPVEYTHSYISPVLSNRTSGSEESKIYFTHTSGGFFGFKFVVLGDGALYSSNSFHSLGTSDDPWTNVYANDVTIDGDTIKTKVCHLKTTTTAAIVEGSANEFTVDFDQEEHLDTSHFSHNSAGVVTVLKAGWYRITANLVYSNATGSARTTVRAFVKKNGTEITSTRTYDYDRGASYGKFSNNKIDTLLNLAANDTIEIANYAFNEDGNTSVQGDECEFIIMSMV